jgi:hypothetical protein
VGWLWYFSSFYLEVRVDKPGVLPSELLSERDDNLQLFELVKHHKHHDDHDSNVHDINYHEHHDDCGGRSGEHDASGGL